MYRIKKYRMTRFSLFTRVFILVIKDWFTVRWKKEDYAEYKGVVLSRKELTWSELISLILCEIVFELNCFILEKFRLFVIAVIGIFVPFDLLISISIVSLFLTIKYERENLR